MVAFGINMTAGHTLNKIAIAFGINMTAGHALIIITNKIQMLPLLAAPLVIGMEMVTMLCPRRVEAACVIENRMET